MSVKKFTIHFPQASAAQANRFAAELREALLDTSPEIQATQVREHPDTMDWGTVLQVVAGSSVLTAIIKTLESWLIKRSDVTLDLSDGDRKRSIQISGLNAKEREKLVKTFLEACSTENSASDSS